LIVAQHGQREDSGGEGLAADNEETTAVRPRSTGAPPLSSRKQSTAADASGVSAAGGCAGAVAVLSRRNATVAITAAAGAPATPLSHNSSFSTVVAIFVFRFRFDFVFFCLLLSLRNFILRVLRRSKRARRNLVGRVSSVDFRRNRPH
jgi:hypothetical protein